MWGWFGGGGGCNVFLTFDAISNIYKKKNLGIQNHYFSFNVFFGFFLYPGNIVKCPFTYSYWLNGWEVVSPNSRYRELYHRTKCSVILWLVRPPRPPVDPDDVNTLTRKIFNISLSNFI